MIDKRSQQLMLQGRLKSHAERLQEVVTSVESAPRYTMGDQTFLLKVLALSLADICNYLSEEDVL